MKHQLRNTLLAILIGILSAKLFPDITNPMGIIVCFIGGLVIALLDWWEEDKYN